MGKELPGAGGQLAEMEECEEWREVVHGGPCGGFLLETKVVETAGILID